MKIIHFFTGFIMCFAAHAAIAQNEEPSSGDPIVKVTRTKSVGYTQQDTVVENSMYAEKVSAPATPAPKGSTSKSCCVIL